MIVFSVDHVPFLVKVSMGYCDACWLSRDHLLFKSQNLYAVLGVSTHPYFQELRRLHSVSDEQVSVRLPPVLFLKKSASY